MLYRLSACALLPAFIVLSEEFSRFKVLTTHSDAKTLTMVARYAHQSGSHIEAAMSKLQNRLSPADNIRSLKREA
jgi:hypothetical protein